MHNSTETAAMHQADYTITLLSLDPLQAAAVFPAEYPAFDGHFPGEPLLPGFMHIQFALDTLRQAGRACRLVEVADAKFLGPILPNMRVTIQLNAAAAADHAPGVAHYEATLSREGGVTLSRFTVTVA